MIFSLCLQFLFQFLDFFNSLVQLVNSIFDLILDLIQDLLLSLKLLWVFLFEVWILILLFVKFVLPLCLLDLFLRLLNNSFLLLNVSPNFFLILIVLEEGHHTLGSRDIVIQHQVTVASFGQMSICRNLARDLPLLIELLLLSEHGLDVANL